MHDVATTAPPTSGPVRRSAPPTPLEGVRSRLAEVPAWAAIAETFIALGWLRAAVEKVISPGWWSGEELADFLADHDGAALTWFEPFLTSVVEPFGLVVAALVPMLQLAIAVALFRGGATRVPGLLLGIGLNLVFIATGAVNPSIFYILLQGGILLWLVERDRSGRRIAWLDIAVGFAGFVGSASLFSIRTLDPASVVDDPGLIMVTLAGLTLLARLVIGERWVRRAAALETRRHDVRI